MSLEIFLSIGRTFLMPAGQCEEDRDEMSN